MANVGEGGGGKNMVPQSSSISGLFVIHISSKIKQVWLLVGREMLASSAAVGTFTFSR